MCAGPGRHNYNACRVLSGYATRDVPTFDSAPNELAPISLLFNIQQAHLFNGVPDLPTAACMRIQRLIRSLFERRTQ